MSAPEPLSMTVANDIAQAIVDRQDHFPDELLHTSCMVVLFNFGDRYTPVRCVGGEWSGVKSDLAHRDGLVPVCPNGHVLIESPDGRRQLGLIDDDRLADVMRSAR